MERPSPPSPFDFNDYKAFVRAWMRSQPSRGRGLFRQLALHLRAHSTFVSQVFSGKRDLSAEQTIGLAQFLALSDRETEHLLTLVEAQRTSSAPLRDLLARRLAGQRSEHHQITSRLSKTQRLSVAVQARFYSHWSYAAVRLATTIDGLGTAEELAAALKLALPLVLEVLNFLVDAGLVEKSGGVYRRGSRNTHVAAGSPYAASHHRNWRLKAIEHHANLGTNDLSFSAPISLAADDLLKVRALLLELVQKVDAITKPSPAEAVAFLNFDLIKIWSK